MKNTINTQMNYLIIKDDEDNIDIILVSDSLTIPDMIDYVDQLERKYNETETGWFGDYLRDNLHPSMTYIDTGHIGNYIVY